MTIDDQGYDKRNILGNETLSNNSVINSPKDLRKTTIPTQEDMFGSQANNSVIVYEGEIASTDGKKLFSKIV